MAKTPKERKKAAKLKVVELAERGTKFDIKRIGEESLNALAASSKPDLSRQAKLELRRRATAGDTNPDKRLDTAMKRFKKEQSRG
jgi:hypothetical protein